MEEELITEARMYRIYRTTWMFYFIFVFGGALKLATFLTWVVMYHMESLLLLSIMV
jgi:hypothetical protein